MKSTGVVRKIDQLGRVVFPVELRRNLNLREGDAMEIFVDGDFILMKKYQATGACAVTGEVLDENKEFAPGLILSPEGADMLFQKLKSERA
ncbi:AbrB/MazE/SpoVT family DNA-binding domain-containing protein [Planococcus versutus]|uniref:SpoVT-AbrB domain-containing protein n=1 Tax=Planococcus versutus TaxID=1302659 RepID=A0A1B1S325_9BACL|nr:AbrB/MazE/SpoVT family DNA-binding domain-containing protein [Planococcus versutus]ANU27583.1 hypothetical protein I858_011365 [Planococcus versutus]